MDGSGRLAAPRPGWAWPGETHTETRLNHKLWLTDRPIPLNHSLPLDWHHVVPWNQLRDGWNALRTAAAGHIDRDPAWKALGAWLYAAGFDDGRTMLAAFQAGNYVDVIGVDGRICWAKWNLVEGPTNTYRTLIADDPDGGDPGGDECDPFYFGSNGLRERSRDLVDWAEELKQTDAKALAKRLSAMKKHRRTPLVRLSTATADLWERLEGERYERYKRPEWTTAGRYDQYGLATSVNHHAKWRKRCPH